MAIENEHAQSKARLDAICEHAKRLKGIATEAFAKPRQGLREDYEVIWDEYIALVDQTIFLGREIGAYKPPGAVDNG